MKKSSHDEPVTKGVLDEAVEAILNGMNKMFSERDKRFDQIDRRLDKLEAGQKMLQRQITDLKIDTPTRNEFDELKGRVVSQAGTNSYTYDCAAMLSATC